MEKNALHSTGIKLWQRLSLGMWAFVMEEFLIVFHTDCSSPRFVRAIKRSFSDCHCEDLVELLE